MPLTLNGTTGVAGIDGSASTPSIQGTDTNTGIWFPAADTVAIATNGTERMRVDSSGNVGVGTNTALWTSANRGDITINGSTDAVLVLSKASNVNTSSYIYYDGTNLIQNVQSAGYMSFNTNATERMRIDANGYVTNPAQPRFSVYRDAGNQSGGQVVVYNGAWVNQANGYNTSTGVFTAPVAGYYFFFWYGLNNQTSAATEVMLQINGGSYADARQWASSNNNNSYSGTAMFYLSASDQVRTYIVTGSIYGTGSAYCRFGGFLLG